MLWAVVQARRRVSRERLHARARLTLVGEERDRHQTVGAEAVPPECGLPEPRAEGERAEPASRVHLVAAFAAVYLIWGSTYLAIRFAIETMPPFLMAAARFLVAGSLVYLWARLHSRERPDRRHWFAAAVVGGLLLLGGNGGVTWAEQRVASGLAALLVATEPLWIVLLDWVRPRGTAPRPAEVVGLLLGFGGVVLLVGPVDSGGGPLVDPLGAAVVVLAALSWAAGSLYSRGAPAPRTPMLGTGMQMLAGGVLLLLVGTAWGEWGGFDPGAVSLKSGLALVYLIVFGAIVGLSAYLWILKHASTAMASTYAYVNPVVAVFLGWSLAGEPLNARVAAAMAVIVLAVLLISLARSGAMDAARGMLSRRASRAGAPREAA